MDYMETETTKTVEVDYSVFDTLPEADLEKEVELYTGALTLMVTGAAPHISKSGNAMMKVVLTTTDETKNINMQEYLFTDPLHPQWFRTRNFLKAIGFTGTTKFKAQKNGSETIMLIRNSLGEYVSPVGAVFTCNVKTIVEEGSSYPRTRIQNHNVKEPLPF